MILENKVAWITGASRGIGRAIAVALAREGAQTVLVARSADHLADTVAEIRAVSGQEPFLADYDITDPVQVGSAFSKHYKAIKKLDIMVNNAGVMNDALLGMISPEQVQQTFAVNVFATIYHMQYAARLMSRTHSGSIVNIASIIGRFGNAGQTVYGASKAAVIGATQSAAKELAKQNIRVNAIAPGFIETDMVRQLTPEKFEERLKSISMTRIGTPQDVAKAAVFLVSDASEYVTGQVFGVDGGMIV